MEIWAASTSGNLRGYLNQTEKRIEPTMQYTSLF